jgi:hypothetical protein
VSCLAAVVAAFAGRLPGDGGKGALEEGVVDDVTLVVFAFDDPVAGIGFALAGVGEDEGGVEALGRIYEKRSAGTEGVHQALLSVCALADLIYFSTTFVKKA